MDKKTVLVTGSSRGIGKAIAMKYAREGYQIVINCAHSFNELLETASEIQALGAKCLPIMADVSNLEAIEHMFEEIAMVFGHVDVVINNAGMACMKLFTDTDDEDWHRVITTNLTSAYRICSKAVPSMVKRQAGCIVNISSIWGITGASCEVAYSASKGGVNAFTKALAKELAPSHIRVNAIACGFIETSMNSGLTDADTQAFIDDIPANRSGKAEEVANLCYYLSSDASTYLTGQVITLDGGLL